MALGAFLANLTTGDVPVYAVLGITVGNTLEALIGAHLLRRVGFQPLLERVSDVVALAVLAGGVSTAVAATLGTTSLLVSDQIASADYLTTWRTWWLGDMGGDLVVAPVLMIVATRWSSLRGQLPSGEAVALVLSTAGAAVLVFSVSATITFLLIPVVIWACLRFGALGAVGVCLMIAAIAVPLTDADKGPFSGHPADDRLLLAQGFLGVASMSSLVLAAMVTQRRQVEDSLQYIATTLQESLLPADLPEMPGAEIAVAYRPAGERHLVGGDFFDWFENDDGSWTVVVGDVVGKGPTAAATTALARYTLRATAMNESQPSRILAQLNEALLRHSPGQNCTIIYSQITLGTDGSARIRLANGGHPPALVLKADGSVRPVGAGTLLGAAPDPRLEDIELELARGDALVMHTDGLTDAFAPEQFVSPEELNAVVTSCAGLSANEIVERIERSLLQHADGWEPRDDVIVLALRPDGHS